MNLVSYTLLYPYESLIVLGAFVCALIKAAFSKDRKAFTGVTIPFIGGFFAMLLLNHYTIEYVYSGRGVEARARLHELWVPAIEAIICALILILVNAIALRKSRKQANPSII